ncbi:energy transducer TonB [Methylobacter psychrophilus]|uniref:energy transducer TonB n=1 Tax=Methylobacter psychrophilus TaxID=96941 RepID=UPI0021D4D77D|nr:energy transducer TonB [Methylobacter psychrophilus]
MTVHFLKKSDFSTSAQNLGPAPSNQRPVTRLFTVVNSSNTHPDTTATNHPNKQHISLNLHSPLKRSEYLLGILVTLVLHLLWFVTTPMAETRQTITPPKPIMVEWLGNSPSHAEPVKPTPQPKQVTVKPTVKPKLKPKKIAASKPVIAAPSPEVESTMTQSQNTLAESPTVATVNAIPVISDSTANDVPVTLPNLNADYLNNPAPDYPPASRELGEQGRVLLRAMINSDGTVAQVVLRKSSGFNRLDQAALDTVKKWRFVPAQRGEQKISAWIVVPVAFSLEG